MRIWRCVILITIGAMSLIWVPTSDSRFAADIDRLIGRIDQNFNVINSEVIRRGQRLSPIFLNNVNANKEVFEELKKDKEKFSNSASNLTPVNTADQQSYVAELQAVADDTSGMAYFLQTAPSDDDAETKVTFETLYKSKANNGWWVCWVSYGLSKRNPVPWHCYPDVSTPLPKQSPEGLASGCKYVISIMDPDKNDRLFPFSSLNAYIEIPRADTTYPVRIPVPYKIKR